MEPLKQHVKRSTAKKSSSSDRSGGKKGGKASCIIDHRSSSSGSVDFFCGVWPTGLQYILECATVYVFFFGLLLHQLTSSLPACTSLLHRTQGECPARIQYTHSKQSRRAARNASHRKAGPLTHRAVREFEINERQNLQPQMVGDVTQALFHKLLCLSKDEVSKDEADVKLDKIAQECNPVAVQLCRILAEQRLAEAAAALDVLKVAVAQATIKLNAVQQDEEMNESETLDLLHIAGIKLRPAQSAYDDASAEHEPMRYRPTADNLNLLLGELMNLQEFHASLAEGDCLWIISNLDRWVIPLHATGS